MAADADATSEVAALLGRAKRAHGAYEASELGGVYDEEWPRWYATYALDNGLPALLGREVTVEALTELLADSWATYDAADPAPAEPWEVHAAGRITADR